MFTEDSCGFGLRDFLEIPYDELETLNLEAKKKAFDRVPEKEVEAHYREYLENEKRIKAVTLCFSDIEGKLHMLDYDKKFFLKSADNLTFDGSSVRGYTELAESDLRLLPDWYSFRWLPSDVFGPGKIIMFASIADKEGKPYPTDVRVQLKLLLEKMFKKDKTQFFMATELEGFLLKGEHAEQTFDENFGFELSSIGGYYNALPGSLLKGFIDTAAEAQRALGFQNEKDHPEVAPSQFELNYSYTDALIACDQIQLYKLTCRQIAHQVGMTATFLPKPMVGINGSGMHTNISLSKGGKNLFYDAKGKDKLSKTAWDFIERTLNHANEICLTLNASVNAYRRLDPNYEAPNQIIVSPTDRGSMIRLPMGNEKTSRIEVRSVGPDANPYLVAYTLLKTGLEGENLVKDTEKRSRTKILPGTIHDAIRYYKSSDFVGTILGEEMKAKYLNFKQKVSDRSPKSLGDKIKNGEVLFQHEVTNQILWSKF